MIFVVTGITRKFGVGLNNKRKTGLQLSSEFDCKCFDDARFPFESSSSFHFNNVKVNDLTQLIPVNETKTSHSNSLTNVGGDEKRPLCEVEAWG